MNSAKCGKPNKEEAHKLKTKATGSISAPNNQNIPDINVSAKNTAANTFIAFAYSFTHNANRFILLFSTILMRHITLWPAASVASRLNLPCYARSFQ